MGLVNKWLKNGRFYENFCEEICISLRKTVTLPHNACLIIRRRAYPRAQELALMGDFLVWKSALAHLVMRRHRVGKIFWGGG